MTFLITGATGFLGRSLVEMLLSQDHSVHYMGRRRDGTMDSRAAFHLWENPTGAAPPLDSVPRLDAIVHLAGEPIAQRWSPEVKQKIRESRVASTRKLVDTIRTLRHRPSVLICASATGYYGNRGDEILTEDAGPGNDFLAEVCIAWEQEADRARELDLRVVKVRTGIVLAPGGGALQKMLPAFRLGLGGNLGNGRQWMPWIHRQDLLNMLVWAAQTESVEGALNGTAPVPVTNAQFTKILARTLHRSALFSVPRIGLRLMMGELADFLFASIRAVPEGARRMGFQFKYSHLEDALSAILQQSRKL
jgi:uncharacterized protein